MVVPFGGAEIYYGTNPLTFAAPGEGDEILTFDMATTVQAWGKVLDARSRNMSIPDTGRSIKTEHQQPIHLQLTPCSLPPDRKGMA